MVAFYFSGHHFIEGDSQQFANLVSGSEGLLVGDGLESCTDRVQVARKFELDGRIIELIDTPGFDDTTKSDADVLNMIVTFFCDTQVSEHFTPHYNYVYR
jgi:hypothetical protein